MKKQFLRFIVVGVFLLNTYNLFGQGTIGTERPTVSTSSHTIAKNAFQFEQGFTYMNNDLLYDGLFRLAVSERGEIRLLTNYVDNSTYWGAKVNFLKQNDYDPGISMQATFGGFSNLVDFRVSWAQKINEKVNSTLNIGKGLNYYVVLAVGYGFNEKTGVFVEGYYDDDLQQFDAGATYLINSETQVDISGGIQTGGRAYISVGVSRRLLFKDSVE
ncbi:MAG: hypothetical protein KDC79_17540 [Cyclobacteriaceae bacterium]|nr:hypothetical protein [Cyclobacteriaceae bacterium]